MREALFPKIQAEPSKDSSISYVENCLIHDDLN